MSTKTKGWYVLAMAWTALLGGLWIAVFDPREVLEARFLLTLAMAWAMSAFAISDGTAARAPKTDAKQLHETVTALATRSESTCVCAELRELATRTDVSHE